jgi:hypothetical protein
VVLLISYAERHIEKDDIVLFRYIQQILENTELPNLGNDDNGRKIEVSCHMIAEVLSKILDIELKHGYFIPGFEHSWLATINRNIIDVYPCGIVGGPLLISHIIIPHKEIFYTVNNCFIDQVFYTQHYKVSAKLVERSILDAIEMLQLKPEITI